MRSGRAVSFIAASRLRRRWPAYLAVAALIGVMTGAAMLAVAGARRTQSAHARFLRSVNASTMSVTSNGGYNPSANARIAAFPEVAESRSWVGINVFVERSSARPRS